MAKKLPNVHPGEVLLEEFLDFRFRVEFETHLPGASSPTPSSPMSSHTPLGVRLATRNS